MLALATVMLWIGSESMVYGAKNVAEIAGVPEELIGFTFACTWYQPSRTFRINQLGTKTKNRHAFRKYSRIQFIQHSLDWRGCWGDRTRGQPVTFALGGLPFASSDYRPFSLLVKRKSPR